MSLRLKLLLLGLATLVLPWGGCQYAREMESALREGEVNSLQAVAQTIAASLQGRTDLMYREPPPASAVPDTPVSALASVPGQSAVPAGGTGAGAPTDAAATPAPPAVPVAAATNSAGADAPAGVPGRSGPYDLEPLVLTAAPLLDGYTEDWPRVPAAWKYFARDARRHFGILTGVY